MAEVEQQLLAYDVLRHPGTAPQVQVIFDGSGMEGIDPDCLRRFVSWLIERREELNARVRLQYGVIADSIIGATLTGILPMLGTTHPFRLFRDAREAFRAATPDGDALYDEVFAAVASIRGVPRELRDLRDFLRMRSNGVTIESAARGVFVSVRTLQRILQEHGTTFSRELREARFAVAEARLLHSDDKIVSVAQRVGLSENALTQLVREKTGASPAELRKRHRET